MGLFKRETHETTIQDYGFGNYGFICSCGAYGRSGPSRGEAVTKANLHKQTINGSGRR
ncbi:hypothetical protein [Streptomyces sp. NBC_01198]|uniref:hypothetical protein n=1 Tax=Streptomyces sp. NBC_01198 TaxID=2903769 RepID=UPI002E1458EE|nr:hypothetical protein OG702_22795 [Streptomyces sp. NBC_01198]